MKILYGILSLVLTIFLFGIMGVQIANASDSMSFKEKTKMEMQGINHWEIIEPYNEYRFLVLNNLWQSMLEEGRAAKIIAPEDLEQADSRNYVDADEYYHDQLLSLKRSAVIEVIAEEYANAYKL